MPSMDHRISRKIAPAVAAELHALLLRAQGAEPLAPLLPAGLALGIKSGFEPLRKFCDDEIKNDLGRIVDERPPSRNIQTIKIPLVTGLGGGTFSRTESGMLQEILSMPNAQMSPDIHFPSVATTEEALTDMNNSEKQGKSITLWGQKRDLGMYLPEHKGMPVFVITPSQEARGFLTLTRRDFVGHLLALNAIIPPWALRVKPDHQSMLDKVIEGLKAKSVAWIIGWIGLLATAATTIVAAYINHKYHISVPLPTGK